MTAPRYFLFAGETDDHQGIGADSFMGSFGAAPDARRYLERVENTPLDWAQLAAWDGHSLRVVSEARQRDPYGRWVWKDVVRECS